MSAPVYQLVTRVKGPAWEPSLQLREQREWPAHAAFMDGLVDAGFIVLGGPVGDQDGFLMVCDAPDEAIVRLRFADDPWVGMGLLEIASVERWTVLLGGTSAGR